MVSSDGMSLAYGLLAQKEGDVEAAIVAITIVRDIADEVIEVLENLFDTSDNV